MYKCNLHTIIISKDQELERLLSQAPVPEHFSFTFKTYSDIEPELFQDADILILTELPVSDLDTIHKQGKADLVLILLAEPAVFSSLTAAEQTFIDDFWPAPYSKDTALFYFRKLTSTLKLKKDLWMTNNYLDATIDSIPDLVWFKDLRGAHLKVNNSFCDTVGKTKQQCEGRGHYYIWDLEPQDYEKGEYVCLETEEEVIRQRKTCAFDEIVKGKQGFQQFLTYKSPIFDTDGSLIGTVGIAHNTTNLQNISRELELLLGSIPFAVLITDQDGTIQYVNKKFCETFHSSEKETCSQPYEPWKNASLTKVTSDGKPVENLWQFENQKKFYSIQESPITDIFQNYIGSFCIFMDVTADHKLHQLLFKNANTDALTGLYNRHYLKHWIKTHSETSSFGILSIDLDHFKHINDTYGHYWGDMTLIATGKVIQRIFPDGCNVRIGGDEFLIILPDPGNEAELAMQADALLTAFRKKFSSRTEWNTASASIGIALGKNDVFPVDELIHQSDLALYEAKKTGRACWRMYTPEIEN